MIVSGVLRARAKCAYVPRALLRTKDDARYLLEKPGHLCKLQMQKLMSDTPRLAIFTLTPDDLVQCTTSLELARRMHERWRSLSLAQLQQLKQATDESWHTTAPKEQFFKNGFFEFFRQHHASKSHSRKEAAALWNRLKPAAKQKYKDASNFKAIKVYRHVLNAFRHRVGAPRQRRSGRKVTAWNFFCRRTGQFFVPNIRDRAKQFSKLSPEQKMQLAALCRQLKRISMPVTPADKPSGMVGFLAFSTHTPCRFKSMQRRVRSAADEIKECRRKNPNAAEINAIAFEAFYQSVVGRVPRLAAAQRLSRTNKAKNDPELKREVALTRKKISAAWKQHRSYRRVWKELTRQTLSNPSTRCSNRKAQAKKTVGIFIRARSSILATHWSALLEPAQRNEWKRKGNKTYEKEGWGKQRAFRRRHINKVKHLKPAVQKRVLSVMMKAYEKVPAAKQDTAIATRRAVATLRRHSIPTWQWSLALTPSELKARHYNLLRKNEKREVINGRYRTKESVIASVKAALSGNNVNNTSSSSALLSTNKNVKAVQLSAIKRHLLSNTSAGGLSSQRDRSSSSRSHLTLRALPRLTSSSHAARRTLSLATVEA